MVRSVGLPERGAPRFARGFSRGSSPDNLPSVQRPAVPHDPQAGHGAPGRVTLRDYLNRSCNRFQAYQLDWQLSESLMYDNALATVLSDSRAIPPLIASEQGVSLRHVNFGRLHLAAQRAARLCC